MNIDPIGKGGDYRRTLAEIETPMTAGRDTPEGGRLGVLVTLVEIWEARHYPLDLPYRSCRRSFRGTSSRRHGCPWSA